MTLEELEALPIIGETASGEGSLSPEEVEALPIIGETARAADALSQSEIDALPILPDEGTVFDVDSLPILDDDQPAKKSLGVGGTLAAQAQAETGRDLGALGTAATYVPVVGSVMKADAHREFNNLERLYTGDFRDTLEGSKLLLANGFSQEDVRRVNAAAGFGRRNLLGNYTEFDIDKFRESVKELVKPRFAEMIRIKNAAAQELQNNDLGFLGKAAVGTIGAAGAVAEMANVPLAGVTLMPSVMNRAANMSEGQYALDENGDIVTLKEHGDADAALLKGFGGAVAERAVWMGLGKLTKMGGGALLKQFPGLDKVLGTAVAKGAQGMAAVTAKLSESAAGRVLLGSAKIIGKMQIGAVPGMMVKSRMTELFDDVIGLNVADAEEREALGAWAKKWVSVSDNAELFVELLGVHLGMKAAGLAVKPLRAAAEKIGLADPSFNRKGKEGQEYEKFLAQFIGEEKVKALSDTDLVHLARLLASEHFTAERAEKFLADLTGDLDAAEKKVAAGESLESVLEGLRTRKAITPEYLEAAKAAAAELRDRVTLDDGQTAKITDAALNAAEGNVEIAAKIAADAKTSLRNKRTQVDDPRGLEALIAESTRKFAPEARAVKIHDLKGERDVGRQIGAIESLGVTTADAAVASGIVRRNANGTLEGGARRAVNILENGTEKMREGVKDGTLDAGVAEELITAAHLELGADTPEARAAFMDAVIDAARRLAETEPRHQEQTARRIIEELGRETTESLTHKDGQGDVAQRVAEAAERARRAIEAEERAEPLEKAAKARESANGAEDLTAVRLTSNNGGVLTCGRFKGVTVRFETLADGVTKEIYVDGLDNRIIADPNRGVDALLLAVELQRLARRTGCQISFDDPLMYEPFKAYLKLADEKGTVEKAQEHLRTRAQLLDLLSRNGLAEGVFYDEISFRRALASDAQGRQFIDNHGDIYGIQLDGNLYFNPAHFDLDIPIHEYGHLAVNLLIDRESALVRRGLELIKDTEYYRRLVEQSETVGHEYEYLRGDENGLRIEALVTMIGDRGGKLVREKGVGAELVQWLKDFWKSFRKALGLEDIPPERVEKMSVNEIVDAINAEMLRGKEFGTRKPLATKETSVRKYDEAEGSGSNGLLRWTQDNGGLFKLPVDLERTQRGGPVHLSTDDANITDFIARALNGRKLMMSQSGKIYVKGENGLPKELALIFGHTPTIGQNDGLGQRLAEELRRPELADATPEQLVEMLRADRTNYAAWKESESRRDGKTLEQRQMEDYYRNQAEAEEAEARTRWEDSGLSLPDYILSRIEDGEAPFDLDWETMREIEHDRAHGRFMVAYHGSPHDFDRFDHSKMGSGEGAQAHGWGTYVAMKEGTSRGYAERLVGNYMHQTFVPISGLRLRSYKDFSEYFELSKDGKILGKEDRVAQEIFSLLNEEVGNGEYGWDDFSNEFESVNLSGFEGYKIRRIKDIPDPFAGKRHLYTVDIPDEKDGNYLHEGEPLGGELMEKIANAFRERGWYIKTDSDWLRGRQVVVERYRQAHRFGEGSDVKDLVDEFKSGGQKELSEVLSSIGFVGIKYDGRQDGPCAVIFNADDVKITNHARFMVRRVGGKEIPIAQSHTLSVRDSKDKEKVKDLFIPLVGTSITNLSINKPVEITRDSMKEYLGSKYSESIKRKRDRLWRAKVSAIGIMDDIIERSPGGDDEFANHKKKIEKSDLKYFRANTEFGVASGKGVSVYPCQIIYAEGKNGNRSLYDIVNISSPRLSAINELEDQTLQSLYEQAHGGWRLKTADSMPDSGADVNGDAAIDGGERTGGARFMVVRDWKKIDELEASPKIKVFRAMQLVDGKLYPPMAAKVNGKFVNPIELGKWEMAEEHPELIKDGKFTLNKGNGSSIQAAYNPYIHTSRSPLNDQFSSAYKRPNLVVVEVEVPESELTSGYKAKFAKDSVGEMSWHSGPVSSKLPKSKERKVILSRYDKPVRILSDNEVADRVAELLDGEDIQIPFNVVTPGLRDELLKRGVKIEQPNHARFMVGNKKPWPEDFPKVTVHTTREAIERKHGEIFKKAKAGDADSALELVSKVVKPQKVRDLLAAHPDAQIVAPVYAEEQSGHNQIPAAYAYYIARIAGLKLDESIKQSVRAFHTGADAFARLSRRAEFIGEVVKGGKYILVDDHITQGGTLSELRHYIENGGGEVVAITTLTASKGSTIISIQKPTIEALKAKFGSTLDENLRKANIAGCVEALTESEGRYILKLSPDTFRARCARSEQESREREVCREVRGTVQDAPDSGVSFDGPRFMARDGDGAGFEDSLLVPRRIDKRVLVANGAGHGEQTPGSVAASLERLNQPRTTMQTLGKVNAVSLPLSELDWLRRQIFGDRTPGTIVRRLPGGKTSASTKAGQVMILGGIIGMVDNTDVAPIKERLKEHGFYRNEDPSWANLMKPAEIRHEQERSDHQLADELLKLADRRGRGEEPGGMTAARRIYANELAKIAMELPRRTEGVIGGVQKMGDAVRTEVKAKFPSGGDKETEARKEAESFLSAFDGEATTGANPPRTMRELTDAMFGAWLVMPEEMRKSAPNWYGAILSAVSSDPRLEKAFKDLSFRMLSRDAYKAVFEDVRKSQQRSVDEVLAKLEEEGNEPIKAGGWSDSLKEGVVVAFHDRLAPVVMRIDGKAKAYLKARKAVLAEMKRKGASKAEIAAVRQEIDLFMGNIAHLKNRLELSRTAMERGVWNEGRRYMLDMLLLENEASKKWGLTEEDKSAYLDMMRIIETQGRSGSHGMDPRQARLALGDMARRLGAEKWARLEQYGRKFHEIMEREFLNDKRVERMWGKGFVDYLRSQSNYVTTKRTFTPEEMDAIDEARQKLKQSGMSNGDTVIEAMYRYGGANGARETLGENAWTARLTGSMAAKREVRGATWEKQQKLMQAARRNQFVIDLRDALLGANVEGVRDFRRDENEFPDNKRYGRINYVENGVRRVLVVPAQIADGLKTQKDILPWMTKFHGITRGLMIDWNPAYWNRNIMRNSGSIEKNMPRMHESWLKTALRVAPGLSPVVDLAMQHLARHSPRAAKVMGALFGRDTIFPYIQQAKRMATLLEDPTAWQDRLWKAEAKGDAGEVAQMMDDLISVKEMLCGNMLVPIRKAYNGGKTEGFANDMMGKAGFRMVQQLEADARRTAVGKVLHVLGKPFRANAKQQEWEDVMAKTIAYLHDRARFGLERSVEESGLTVKRNVSIAEGERRGAAAPLIQKTMSQFYNMIEKGVTRSWRAMKERPGETAVKMARTWVGRFVGGVIAGGAVTQWIRSLFDGDEEKIAASPLGDVYDFAKWMELNNRNLSEYVRNHYQTIPVWASEDGYSSIVIGMPLNDEDSFIAPSADFAAKAFVQASGGVTRDLEFGKMLMDSTYRAVVPDFEMSTPTVKIIRDTLLALVDNPTDYFSGAPVYDNDVWTLRNENRERRGAFALAMAKQVWNDIGGRGFMKFDRNGVDTAQGTRTVPSKWIGIAMNNIPVLSPMISSFIKVQVGSPEKDAKPIQEAERRIASIQRVCALQLMEESQKIGGALNRLNPARYAQCLERWQKEYGLTDNQMHKIEQRFLNAWNLHENGDAAAIKTTNRNIRRARRLGREDLERLLIRGDL